MYDLIIKPIRLRRQRRFKNIFLKNGVRAPKKGPFCSPTKYFNILNVHFVRLFSAIQESLSALRSHDSCPRSWAVLSENIYPQKEKKYFLGGGGPQGPRPSVFILGVRWGVNPNR